MTVEISPKKQPVQARARATWDAILGAAARILLEGGAEALTTNRVAEVAGVSIGSLYQYFPSKQAILAEMIRGLRAEMLGDLTTAVAASAEVPLSDAIEIIVRASMQHHVRNGRLAEVLESLDSTLPLDAERQALKARVRALMVARLAAAQVAQPEQAAQDLAALVGGMTDTAVAAGETDFDSVAERVLRAVRGYLAA